MNGHKVSKNAYPLTVLLAICAFFACRPHARYEDGKLKASARVCMAPGPTSKELFLGNCRGLLLFSIPETSGGRPLPLATVAALAVCVEYANQRDDFYEHCGEEPAY